MAAATYLSQSPLQVGLKHALIGAVALMATGALAAGGIAVLGDPADAGPSVTVAVPALPPPRAANERPQPSADVVNSAKPEGLARFFMWRTPDGGLTPWRPGTPTPGAPDIAKVDEAARAALIAPATAATPTVTTPAEAAAADPVPPTEGGTARIMAPAFGTTQVENGVRVSRGGVGGGQTGALVAAPLAGIHEQGPNGLLPMIGSDGRTIYSAYRRPFTDSGRPKVAIVVGGLGLNSRVTQRAISELPPEVTLSFVPYAANLQGWINQARAAGHEVLIELPMEPMDYPDNDPGPHTLLAAAPADENIRRLEYLLSRASGYFGVTNYLGGRFAGSGTATAAVMVALKNRGVGFVSDGSSPALATAARSGGLRMVTADRALDQRPAAADVDAQLGALEAQARQGGAATGFGVGYAVTISQVAAWARGLESRGLTLAPASALMR
ncbi:MAG: divergent polysaccharide deacetylase family protein [Hyphomonadaceae bacterium]|jgi:hypothetical protein|nr:divergent polysaccharide deacetylase family protein [Hyphomonadaceae bacterium]